MVLGVGDRSGDRGEPGVEMEEDWRALGAVCIVVGRVDALLALDNPNADIDAIDWVGHGDDVDNCAVVINDMLDARPIDMSGIAVAADDHV